LCFANAGENSPHIQLGAENNIEKSRCLAQLQKTSPYRRVREPSFSGLRRRWCAYDTSLV
jgi:hypothetical protein